MDFGISSKYVYSYIIVVELLILISVKQWGHMTDKYVSEDEYSQHCGLQQTEYEYQDRVREDHSECKFYQTVGVSISLYHYDVSDS